ncbi:hypothetical protein BS47DRAFT_1361739 [Hydnum rufescens UP504]|uniref:Uncharacterized protein n=1 Tax=Hydnum rufescens UP504 TaxID=1448309 RepID=A0A9P6AYT1_9AGAM|nr:hypothetical protein BS47DRAFT_1361739 [Hydnum rufescens UP504]
MVNAQVVIMFFCIFNLLILTSYLRSGWPNPFQISCKVALLTCTSPFGTIPMLSPSGIFFKEKSSSVIIEMSAKSAMVTLWMLLPHLLEDDGTVKPNVAMDASLLPPDSSKVTWFSPNSCLQDPLQLPEYLLVISMVFIQLDLLYALSPNSPWGPWWPLWANLDGLGGAQVLIQGPQGPLSTASKGLISNPSIF